MRIAQITPVFPPYRGGIGTMAAQYAQDLKAAGFVVVVFTPDYHHEKIQTAGVERGRPFFSWGNAAVLPALLWRLRQFDLWHLHYPFFGSDFLVALAARIYHRPLIITFHMRPKANGWLGMVFTIYRWFFERFVLTSAKTVLVSSLDYAHSVGLHHSNLVEMPLGADEDRFFSGQEPLLRSQLGIRDGEVVFLFVGGLDRAHYFKGLEILLSASAQLPIDLPWRLLIVGDGDLKSRYESQSRDLSIDDRVIFVGSVPFADLPKYYRAAEVQVLPSIDRSEAWGLVTVEAQLSGLPSIVSDLPGVRTVILPGETGLLIPPIDVTALSQAMDQLINDQVKRASFGERALVRARAKYESHALTARLLSIYNGDKVKNVV